jgi:hypothetical protein
MATIWAEALGRPFIQGDRERWDRRMSRQSREAERLDRIRSVSLEDIVNGRHTRWRRFLKRAKTGLIVVGLFGLAAALGSAAYYLSSGPNDGTLLAAQPVEPAAPLTTGSISARSPEPVTTSSLSQPASQPENQPAGLALLLDEAAFERGDPRSSELTRVPRPRPEATVTVGSVPPPAPVRALRAAPPPQQTAVVRRAGPCRTLQTLTARLPIQLRCPGQR